MRPAETDVSVLRLSRNLVLVLLALAPMATPARAQLDLLDDRWQELGSDHFTFFSQASARQTQRLAQELEYWRQAVARLAGSDSSFAPATVPNYVFLFAREDSFQHFGGADAPAFFFGTPRANFMALVPERPQAMRTLLHHYAHFLLRNFIDLRLPRWYEEGLAGYLSRVRVARGRAGVDSFAPSDSSLMEELSRSLSMERLLYRDEALASPRVIQIANLKAESLVYFLRHAARETGWRDRGGQLDTYLELMLQGRRARFAFDQAFDVTPAQLDEEFNRFLLRSRWPSVDLPLEFAAEPVIDSRGRVEAERLAIMLGELGLNGGRSDTARAFFQWSVDNNPGLARGHSGLGDSLRFQEPPETDQAIARLFEQALELAPRDPEILMDYGEYWEAELQDCDKTYPDSQRRLILADIAEQFEKALTLAPENPEAHLAMGQVYLFEGQDWQQGLKHQRKAFSLLPADSFILEQTIKYLIAQEDFTEAERLINEMAQQMHFFGEPEYVSQLRLRLMRKQRNENFDACQQI